MAKPKQYRVVDKVGVVGFNGVIHTTGDVVDTATVPVANLKAWLRFGQVEEVSEEAEKPNDDKPATAGPSAGGKGKK